MDSVNCLSLDSKAPPWVHHVYAAEIETHATSPRTRGDDCDLFGLVVLLEKTFRLRVRRSLRSSSKSSSSKLSVLLKLARTSARAFCCIVPGPNHPRITLDVSCSLRYPNPHRALSSPVKTRAMSDPMKLDATLSGDSLETMDERITDLNTPSHSVERVRNWDHVATARQLRDLGVEAKHCDIFEQQEITGDVLLDMDQEFILMKDFDFGVMGKRLKTWHTIKAFQEKLKAFKPPAAESKFCQPELEQA
ncbi:hypothetical protein V8E54_006089 [Elaphomyces granulatus]